MTIQTIQQQLKEKFNSEAAMDVSEIFQFEVKDAENFYIKINNGECEVNNGSISTADITMALEEKTLESIVSGEIDGMQAFMAGKLKIQGNMLLAMRLQEFFNL